MATVDWVILGVLALSTLISIRRGFVKEALSLLTWIAAVAVAWFFGDGFAALFVSAIETDFLRVGLSCFVLFIATLIAGSMINNTLVEYIRTTGLSGLDRTLGMCFGFARGAIIVLVAVAGLHYWVPVEEDDWYRESRLIPPIVLLIERLGPALWAQREQPLTGWDV